MRLIDADALKTPIEDRIDNIPASEYDEGWNNAIYAVIDEIDNAPTVEDRTREVLSLQETIRKLTKESPQGEWIKIFENPFTNGYICSICGHKIQVTEQFLPEVTECEGCGAEMKGGNK